MTFAAVVCSDGLSDRLLKESWRLNAFVFGVMSDLEAVVSLALRKKVACRAAFQILKYSPRSLRISVISALSVDRKKS